MAENSSNPYDINGQHFNPDMYFHKLLKVSLLLLLCRGCVLYMFDSRVNVFHDLIGMHVEANYGSRSGDNKEHPNIAF